MRSRNYKEGSTEYTALETKMVKLAAELETDNKMFKNEINKKRAKMVHQVYLSKSMTPSKKFCNHHKFTVIIRFSRADLSSNDPKPREPAHESGGRLPPQARRSDRAEWSST